MTNDRASLLKFGVLGALLVALWLLLLVVVHNTVLAVILGWVGIGLFVVYYRWTQKHNSHVGAK